MIELTERKAIAFPEKIRREQVVLNTGYASSFKGSPRTKYYHTISVKVLRPKLDGCILYDTSGKGYYSSMLLGTPSDYQLYIWSGFEWEPASYDWRS